MSKTIDEIIEPWAAQMAAWDSISEPGEKLASVSLAELAELCRLAQLAALERAAELTARLGEYRSGKQVAAEIRKLKPE